MSNRRAKSKGYFLFNLKTQPVAATVLSLSVMKPGLKPGLEQDLIRVVTRDLCVSQITGLPSVLATAEMIRMMEMAAYLLLQPYYEPSEASVGTAVNIRHLKAAPLGVQVRAVAKLTGVDGRRCLFEVAAFDEKEKIGEGTHERFVIDLERYRARLEAKL